MHILISDVSNFIIDVRIYDLRKYTIPTLINGLSSLSAVPTHAFADDSYVGFEEDDQVTAYVVRGGDVTMTSSVRCYTRQGSAEAGVDFEERPDTDAARVEFGPGQSQTSARGDVLRFETDFCIL